MLKEQLLLRGASHSTISLSEIPTPLRKQDIVPGMRFPTSNVMSLCDLQMGSIIFIDETDSAMLPLSALTRKVKDIYGNTYYSTGDLDNEVDYSLLEKKATIVIDWIKAHQCKDMLDKVYIKHTFGYHLE